MDFIRNFGNLGTLEEPDEYIEDSLPMQTALLTPEPAEPHQRMLYYSGTQGNKTVGLCGSMGHLIGKSHSRDLFAVGSFVYDDIFAAMQAEMQNRELDKEQYPSDLLLVFSLDRHLNARGRSSENLHFMAKRLLMSDDTRVILGTPLYVTKED